MINVEQADIELISTLAKREDVKKISSDHGWEVELGWKEENKYQNVDTRQGVIEWNVAFVRAPQAWALGGDGTGFTVANADTGIAWRHSALISHYRGNGEPVNHNYNWWDGVKEPFFRNTTNCPYNSPEPCDDNGHGTHTTGTAAGGTNDRKIGVAPGAKWIGCRLMEAGFARDKTIISCLQFFLAPTDLAGRDPKPELRPVAIGNSYGCNPIRCPDSEVQRASVEALHAAGVFMSVSAGNSGPGCSSVDRAPTHYEKSFVVGATDFNNTNIASFSSRGPVRVDGSNRRKPDIVAPGVRVTSSTPPNNYQVFSGTSMSSPVVNGAIASLYSAVPGVQRRMACVQDIFQRTALHQPSTLCSSTQQSPNNVFGYGSINMEEAIKLARTQGCPP